MKVQKGAKRCKKVQKGENVKNDEFIKQIKAKKVYLLKMMKWRNDEMMKWRNDEMTKWRNDEMTKWWKF